MENPKQVTSSLTGYDAIYNLVPNEEHIQPADDSKYKKTALALVLCLLNSQFFPPEVSSLEDTDVVYVASLLLRHIRQLICNAHAKHIWNPLLNMGVVPPL
ncbi:hypothetical protein EB796_003230 [Bugula neritina]|uniref:Uncharacterized protein n=1 Tax=Bugula neritina TaxID=10212 RepID=A0A7J7KJM7_BUGNE|nr:hypothetical protein EB796_003230 [Bugula neritina]